MGVHRDLVLGGITDETLSVAVERSDPEVSEKLIAMNDEVQKETHVKAT